MSNVMQEEKALAKTHALCVDLSAIWRPTTGRDFGVDGEIEFMELADTSISTGLKVAVQAKGGPSHFKEIKEEPDSYVFYPTESQIRYWRNYVLPVILVMYNPATGDLLYTEVKPQLAAPSARGAIRVLIPKASQLRAVSGAALRTLAETHRLETDSGQALLKRLKGIEVSFGPCTVTGIDFLIASLFIDADAIEFHKARTVQLVRLLREPTTMGAPGEGLLRLLETCASQISHARITRDPFWDVFSEWVYETKLFPSLTLPLNQYGTQAVKFLREHASDYLDAGKYTGLSIAHPAELMDEVSKRCQDAAAYTDNREIMADAELDSFST